MSAREPRGQRPVGQYAPRWLPDVNIVETELDSATGGMCQTHYFLKAAIGTTPYEGGDLYEHA
jgi:hypothetical protein